MDRAQRSSKRPTRIDLHVGSRLCAVRIAHDMTQDELGKRLGIGSMQVRRYERGTDRVSAMRLFEIAKVFGVRVGTFFEGLG